MSEDRFSRDLRDVAERLRAERAEASPLQLDEIKLRAISRASRGGSPSALRTGVLRSRLVSLVLVVGLLGGSTGALAASGAGPFKSSSNSNNASRSEYCPPTSHQPGKPKKPGPAKCGEGDKDGKGKGNKD